MILVKTQREAKAKIFLKTVKPRHGLIRLIGITVRGAAYGLLGTTDKSRTESFVSGSVRYDWELSGQDITFDVVGSLLIMITVYEWKI